MKNFFSALFSFLSASFLVLLIVGGLLWLFGVKVLELLRDKPFQTIVTIVIFVGIIMILSKIFGTDE